MYDRLLEYDSSGEIVYSLAESIRFLPNPNAIYSPIHLQDNNLLNVIDNMYEYGWKDFYEILYIDDFTRPNDFLNYIGETYMEVTLRTDVYYQDGSVFDAYELYDYISFVKNNGNGSRAYIQWLPVVDMYVDSIDDYKIVFELNFSNLSYGLLEFIYSLSSPISSIGKIENGTISLIGTGAYEYLDSDEQTYVTLSKNIYWWKDNIFSADILRFVYDDQLSPLNLNSSYDIEIISSEGLIPQNSEVDEFYFGEPTYVIANNPIILKSNHDESIDSFFSDFINLDIFYDNSLDMLFDGNGYINSLLKESYDYWAYDNKFNGTKTNNFGPQINVACRNTKTVSYIASVMQGLYEADQIYFLNTYIIGNDFYQIKCDSVYNFYIDEIEVEANNRILSYLDSNTNIYEISLLGLLKRCGTYKSYQYVMANIQELLVENESFAYLGWTYKCIYVNNNINIGYEVYPVGFCPYGDASRIDLRYIS